MIGYILGLLGIAWISELSWSLLVILATALGVACVALSVSARWGQGLSWLRELRELRGFGARLIPTQLIGLLIGALYAALWGEYQLSHRLPDEVGKVDLELKGVISSIVRVDEGSQQFLLQLSEPNPIYPKLRAVRLRLYADKPELKQADELHLTARLQTPQSYLNPYSPDSRRKALQRRIDATGYVRELHARPELLSTSASGLRQKIYDHLNEHFKPSVAAFLSALVLGHSIDLSAQQWELLSTTGTVHLVIVSGLHLGVLALAGLFMGRVLAFALRLGYPKSAVVTQGLPWVLALLLTTLYLWFGGAGLALQRAWVLISVLLVGQLFRRTPTLSLRFKLALLLVTLLDPLAVLDLGFWLSFGLVWILMQLGRLRDRPPAVFQAMRVQLVLSLLLLPVLMFALSQLNLLSVLSNLWAIPWVSAGVLILPLMLPLGSVTGWGQWLVEQWINLFWRGLLINAEIGLSPMWTPAPLVLTLLALVGVALLLMPLRLRLVGLVLLLPALLYAPAKRQGFAVTLLDVGQGQAAIIDLPGERWVYDTGPAFGDNFAVAQLTLIPELKRRPDSKPRLLIVSHGDRDHAGGVEALKRFNQSKMTLSGQPEQVAGRACHLGFARDIGGVHVRVGGLAQVRDDNDASCWIYITNGACSLLIAGDLSTSAEERLMHELESEGVNRPLTWLHLSHHGSKTSTGEAWLDFWQPNWALNSRGRNNHFGHPHPSVTARLAEREIGLLDTAEVGAIYLEAEGSGCSTTSFLQTNRRYWH